MQSPMLYFDHINKVVTKIQPGPDYERKLQEIAAAGGTQSTSGGTRPAGSS